MSDTNIILYQNTIEDMLARINACIRTDEACHAFNAEALKISPKAEYEDFAEKFMRIICSAYSDDENDEKRADAILELKFLYDEIYKYYISIFYSQSASEKKTNSDDRRAETLCHINQIIHTRATKTERRFPKK